MKYLSRPFFLLIFVVGLLQAAEVEIDLFYETGCSDCQMVREEVLPELDARFGGLYVLNEHDLAQEENFSQLLRYQNALNVWQNEPVSIVVDQKIMLCGVETIRAELASCVEKCILDELSASLSAEESELFDEEILAGRFDRFTLSTVILAGLLDGINPCAISTLVFFMSLLAVSKVRNQQLILLGISFCLASFVTYLALGFGLLRVLNLFAGFKLVRSIIEWVMITVLLILAILSFRDAFRFRNAHDGHDVTLQLSIGMKKRIHSVMRKGLKSGHLILGGFFIGTLVTALESVCTGQVYVPTLVLILKNNAVQMEAWLYLLAYNLLFILPLILTFIAVYFGLRTETLLRWSRKNVVVSKVCLGLFFMFMVILNYRFK
ncbi:MAG: hypothetical protein PWQ29_999 [Verrucomicrobiota bacterium]|jgi:cytochrome c biogenesis protein CcdA|nr:hypothetical protein [Verrucomicrobiota bacterium]